MKYYYPYLIISKCLFHNAYLLLPSYSRKGIKPILKNYRPLSLTNTDYKIITFIFARLLQKVIYKLISKEQSAYIKGRFIGINAMVILDIYEYCMEHKNDGILLFIDFEKAFDSVEWHFLFHVLNKELKPNSRDLAL